MWEADRSALTIVSGQELEMFDLGTVDIDRRPYTVLTGFEGTGKCFWCGGELKGKLKRYCRGHMQLYYRHFEWGSASGGAMRRAQHKCENCGLVHSLQVHHIVPLRGSKRTFTAYNLPWNLVALCLECHHQIHRIMNGESRRLRRYLNELKARALQPALL